MPEWLSEVVRQRRAPVPWADMARAALAICVPLSAAFAAGRASIGVLPAMGGLLGILAGTGGPYLTRVKRVSAAVLLGGGTGLTIGAVIHGHGWVAVIALVCVAGVSGLLSSAGDPGSITGLQLLVYAGLGLGPVGAERPVWHVALGFIVGGAWALLLILPGWLWSPHGKEQQSVAAVYTALAAKMSAIGTAQFPAARREVTAALNLAYDELLTVRARSTGRNRRTMRLVALLNASHQVVVVLISLLRPGGWHLAGDRLLDTVVGCLIVVVVGFLPWWTSWYAHLPAQFGVAADLVCTYLVAALAGPGDVSRLRRGTYRAIADLRADFQRTMSEPPAISRRASAWWPAVVGLEDVMDAITAATVEGQVPSADRVRALSAVLRTACMAAVAGGPVGAVSAGAASAAEEDGGLAPVVSAVRALVGVLREDSPRLTL